MQIMANYPQIVVGTYEEFLLGYEIEKSDDGTTQLTLNMASHAHQGSIRCLAAHRHLLASSGADEYVNVYTMVSRKEVAVLTPHEGTVTSLVFVPDGTHLISGSQDGSITIFRCSDWTLMKVWKDAHKKANGVVGLSVHPSGKLLLSIGADHILRVWNLIKGRQAYAVNFSKKISPGSTLNLVSWSHDGSHYAVAVGQEVEIYNVETAAVVYVVKSSSRISCFDLSEPGLIALGRDDGKVEIHNFEKKQQILEHEAHEKRVKCLQFFKQTEEELITVTADSLGVIRLWRWKKLRKVQRFVLEGQVNADCRIVCLTLLNPNEFVKKEVDESDEIPNGLSAKKNITSRNGETISSQQCYSVDDATEASKQVSPTLKKDPTHQRKNVKKSDKKRSKQIGTKRQVVKEIDRVVSKRKNAETSVKEQKNLDRSFSNKRQCSGLSPSSSIKRQSVSLMSKKSPVQKSKRASFSTSKWNVT